MVTIYLDKQVFSYLFKAKDKKYALLREKILSHRDEFIFFYSNGHLFDLQNDQTSIKYAEMEFMQSIVDGNRLIYEDSKRIVLKQAPHDVFESLGKIGDFSWLENFDLSQMPQELRRAINNIVDIGTKDLAGQLGFDWLVKRTPISEDELIVDSADFMFFMKSFVHSFYEDKDMYKRIRDNTIATYNPTSITTDGVEVFNEQLSLSPLGLSFLEMIKATFNQTGLPSSDPALVYYLSYMYLDLMGVNKESRGKVKFRNMQIDCCHSFFGSYCDCIVSNDEGVRIKSKTLYNLFGFGAKVYSVDEFIEKFDEAIINNKKSAREYFGEFLCDYNSRKVLKTESTTEHITTYLETSNKFFGYFNCMVERKSKDETIVILHKNNDFNQSVLAKEIGIIVNRMVRVFNEMGANFSLFDWDKEYPLIEADNWSRILMLNDADICLTKFPQTPMLCLWIRLKHLNLNRED